MIQVKKQFGRFLRQQPKLGKKVYLARSAVVLGDVTLGDGSSVWYGAVLRGDLNRIVIGHHTNIQDNAVVHVADAWPCLLGNWTTVGHGAVVHACTIGDEVLVGMGAVILDGAVVGDQSLIGAKALVTQGTKVPPGSLVLGAPAKVARLSGGGQGGRRDRTDGDAGRPGGRAPSVRRPGHGGVTRRAARGAGVPPRGITRRE